MTAPAAHTLFAYGTMLDTARQIQVVGRACNSRPATLLGYRWYQGKWPYILPSDSETDTVPGRILTGLFEHEIGLIDAYEVVTPQDIEGQMRCLYRRAISQALTDDSNYVPCWVYLPVLADWPEPWKHV